MELNYHHLLRAILDVGEGMLNSGAEISRVEESIWRMCAAYQVARVNAFTITSNIIVTLEVDSETVITQTRRIYPSSNDFTRLDRFNHLCRHICVCAPSPEDIQRRYGEIISEKPAPKVQFYGAAILAATAFAVFFGGTVRDAIATALVAAMIEFLSLSKVKKQLNPLLYLFGMSFLSGLGGILLVRVGLGQQLDKIHLGCIMLTIPGVATTTSVRDLLTGDTVSGLARLCESLLRAGCIAGGFYVSMLLWGRGL